MSKRTGPPEETAPPGLLASALMWVILIVCLPFVLLVLGLVLPTIAVWNRLMLWRFRFANSERTFLICGSRHGWREFLVNNVLPVLPEGMAAVWIDEPEGHDLPDLIRRRFVGRPKPFAFRPGWNGDRILDLHERWLRFKNQVQANDRVRSQMLEELRSAATFLGH